MSDVNIDFVTLKDVEDYQNNGVVVLRGVFTEWIQTLSHGAEFNVENPSPAAIIHNTDSHKGRFLEDFCNWERIPEYKEFIYNSSIAPLAAKLMKSQTAQFFHDHYLDKEASTGVATPWHQDIPYYCVEGEQTISFWTPLDSRAVDVSLQCLAESHKLPKEIRPTSWATMGSFYEDDSSFMDLSDIKSDSYEIKVWSMEPGDVVAFNFKTIHAANPNIGNSQSRTISFRFLGDDVRFLQRPGRTSPNFPGINQKSGERLREDWFPVIWTAK